MLDEGEGTGVQDRVAALEAAVEARTRDLQSALDQRSALLNELDHRVKNNLQLISSLMLMQARRASDPAVREALSAMQERLTAVGIVHRRLFQAEDVRYFDLADFMRDMLDELAGAASRQSVEFVCALKPAAVPATKAAPMALLVNELLTNALRHGFAQGASGTLYVSIDSVGGAPRIEIRDTGVGRCPGQVADDGTQVGFGLTIVELLGRQLGAHIERQDAHPGVRVTVSLPKETVAAGHE